MVEGVWGLSFDQPLRHMREYLEVLMPLLHGEGVSFQGETLQVATGPLGVVAPAPDVIVAALGPQMLELTGRVADGTATWMTGLRTIDELTVPTITASASAAGRPKPRVMVSLPVNVTDDVDAARARADEMFASNRPKDQRALPVLRQLLREIEKLRQAWLIEESLSKGSCSKIEDCPHGHSSHRGDAKADLEGAPNTRAVLPAGENGNVPDHRLVEA